jgi:hypothetical protein
MGAIRSPAQNFSGERIAANVAEGTVFTTVENYFPLDKNERLRDKLSERQ